ncbi:uncharacterized protein [Diadema antillarum]|uniref:uncharacterized protein n=1 Tax=Diadema antillarum TaxID=105358 RepID=UPI003A8A98CB
MASSTSKDECSWWIEKDDGNLCIHRIKNGASMRIPIENILPSPSSMLYIMVTTAHPDHGIIEKKFSLKDFQCMRNDVSSLMENSLETGQQFVDRFTQLFHNSASPQTHKGGRSQKPLTENIVTDACEMEAINGKRVKFGNDYIIEVPITLLSSPPQQRLVRQLNQTHVEELKVSLQKHGVVFNNLTVHIPNHLPSHINKCDVIAGHYTLETIGGNHTREAIAKLKEQFVSVPVIVYAGLTNAQALMVGYEHNRLHLNSRAMTFEEDVSLFRRKVVGDPDKGLSQHQRTQWRQQMAGILGLPIKDIRLKYRVHSFLASQPAEIWVLIKQLMNDWERRTIQGQPMVALKPSHLRFLEAITTQEELKDTLSRILAGDMSYRDARFPEKTQTPDTSSTAKRAKEDNMIEWEARLRAKEARLNEWETRLQLQEKPSLESKTTQTEELGSSEELSNSGEQTSNEDHATDSTTAVQLPSHGRVVPQEVKMKYSKTRNVRLHMPSGKICKQGEWVAVLYGRKASVGRVVDVSASNTATVQFLKGKRLNSRDIQEVPSKFLICPVAVEHDIAREDIIIPDSVKEDIKMQTDLYIQTYM